MAFVDISAVRTQLTDATLSLAVTTRAAITAQDQVALGGQLRTDGGTYYYDVFTHTGQSASVTVGKGEKVVSCDKAVAKQAGATLTITIPRHCLGQTKHVADSLNLQYISSSATYSDDAYVSKAQATSGDPTFGPRVGLG